MKRTIIFLTLVASTFFGSSILYAWNGEETHPWLTEEAIKATELDTFIKNDLGLYLGVNTKLEALDLDFYNFDKRMKKAKKDPRRERTVSEWIVAGSILEDYLVSDLRFKNHFHDPIRNSGLNNTEYPYWLSCNFTGVSARSWAIDSDVVTGNWHTWRYARLLYHGAITGSQADLREQNLAVALLDLGHACHLLEDMGVPAHVRNDSLTAHVRSVIFDKGEALETYVEEKIKKDKQCVWSGASPLAYDRVSYYFDADIREPNAYLSDGVLHPAMWGLSERTNYQFLSLNTIFRTDTESLYYFPHPAVEHMETVFVEGQKRYFNGVNYGVSHMARQSYTHYRQVGTAQLSTWIDRTNTVDDEKVVQEYADITIPRTIDYTAGLINYFFRGRLNVKAQSNQEGDAIEITIKNVSNNSGTPQILHDGAFRLMWDNQDGVRSTIAPAYFSLNMPSTLGYNQTLEAELDMDFLPAGQIVEQYILLYEGGISTNPTDPDPNDLDAIAVKTFRAEAFPQEGREGGYIVLAGDRTELSEGGYASVWAYDYYGNLLWTRDTGTDTHKCVLDNDENVYVLGTAANGCNIFKYSSEGVLLSSNYIGPESFGQMGDQLNIPVDIVYNPLGFFVVYSTGRVFYPDHFCETYHDGTDYYTYCGTGYCHTWLVDMELNPSPIHIMRYGLGIITQWFPKEAATDSDGNIYIGYFWPGNPGSYPANKIVKYSPSLDILVEREWEHSNGFSESFMDMALLSSLRNEDLLVTGSDFQNDFIRMDRFSLNQVETIVRSESERWRGYGLLIGGDDDCIFDVYFGNLREYDIEGNFIRQWDDFNFVSQDNIGKLWGAYQLDGFPEAYGIYCLNPQSREKIRLVNHLDDDVSSHFNDAAAMCGEPQLPVSITPSDGQTGCSTAMTLEWQDQADAMFYDVYLNEVLVSEDRAEPNYCPESLEYDTVYTWQIVPKNIFGDAPGEVWTFMTEEEPLPQRASYNMPQYDGQFGLPRSFDLDFFSSDAESYDIYFGTTNPPPYIVNQTGTTYPVSGLNYGAKYYFRIDSRNWVGPKTGWTWDFTTIYADGEPLGPCYISPRDGAPDVSLTETLSWHPQNDADYYLVFVNNDPPVQVTTTTYAFQMQYETTYEWSIMACNNAGQCTPGAIWTFTTEDEEPE